MFDFDCGGMGWSYDIAVYRWALETRKRVDRWEPFLEGYREQRPLKEADLAAVPIFVGARHFWLLGLHAGNAWFFGRNLIAWDFWLKLIRDWDANELKG